jgi:heme/copper-type cytochrome/quinol oxidase subunit 3
LTDATVTDLSDAGEPGIEESPADEHTEPESDAGYLGYPRTEWDDLDHLPPNTGITHNKLAMWAFLGSDCLLFGALISTYLLVRNTPEEISGAGPPIRDVFDIPFTSVSSFVLLMSSMSMALAVGAIARGDTRRTRLWLVTTAILGSLFIGGQVYEFTAFYNEGFGYTTNISTSAFYTLTGFHGAHVSIGILMLLSLYWMVRKGRIGQAQGESVEIAGLYWHFVDIVWIVIFAVVYLIR